MVETYGGVKFTRNARGGLVAPRPGGYERDNHWHYSGPEGTFADPEHGHPPTIEWEKQHRRRLHHGEAEDA